MISIRKLSKKYNDFYLNIKQCDFNESSLVSIFGNNGTGKSTLLKAISNMTSFEGRIFIQEINNKKSDDWKRHISTFLGEEYLLDFLNKVEYLNFYCGSYGVDYIREIHKIPALKHLYDSIPDKKLIRDFSKGNRTKLGVIAVLLSDSKNMILDEPFSSLDFDSQETLKSLIKEMKGKKTILITSHNLDLVLDVCDRFLVIDNGELILDKLKTEPVEKLKKEIKDLTHKKKETTNIDWLK